MPIPRARRMNLIALAFLITALIAFVVFHFTVFIRHLELEPLFGWQIWPEVWGGFSRPNFNDPAELIACTAFCTSAMLITISPWILPFLRNSRLAWWLLILMSGAVLIGLSGTLVANYFPHQSKKLGTGFYCLIAAQVLHFAGLLFIRREVPPASLLDR